MPAKLFFSFATTLLFASGIYAQSPSKSRVQNHPDWALLPFKKMDNANPVLSPDNSLIFNDPVSKKSLHWADKNVFNPAAVVKNDTLFLLIRAQDKSGTSRIGLAYSIDGLHFTIYPTPVLYPDNDAYKKWEWPGGCEDPRIVQDNKGTYYMTYTGYDGTTARLLIATSKDLHHWTKQGPAFAQAYNGKYKNFWSKSGSIVSKYEDGKIVAAKIHGQYYMYWGDQDIWLATSNDLIHWTPVLNKIHKPYPQELTRGIAQKAPELTVVFGPRKLKFDSDLVESGPPAMLTNQGIVLIYNSRNIPAIGNASLPEGTYAAAQILMDKNNPAQVRRRMEYYFIKPEQPYEITGEVNNVCFVEGLAYYKGQWFSYYGTADSKIAVAVKE